jgi:hypothetical protein
MIEAATVPSFDVAVEGDIVVDTHWTLTSQFVVVES